MWNPTSITGFCVASFSCHVSSAWRKFWPPCCMQKSMIVPTPPNAPETVPS
jgi:hypothetical protein